MARVFDPGAKQSLRHFGRAMRPPRLFDDKTPGRRQRRSSLRRMVAAAALASIGMVLWNDGHGGTEWIGAIPGVIALVVAAAGFRALFASQEPTVTCAGCGAVGWVEDVKAHGGRCPHCGATQFRADGHWRRGSGDFDMSSSSSSGDSVITGAALCAGIYCVAGDNDFGGDSSGDSGDSGGDGGGGDGGGGD